MAAKNVVSIHRSIIENEIKDHPIIREWYEHHRIRFVTDGAKKGGFECKPTIDEIIERNAQGQHVWFVPNRSNAKRCTSAHHHINGINYLFVDRDFAKTFKASELAAQKKQFVKELKRKMPPPTVVVDSGYGIHAYWRVVKHFPIKEFTKFQRRIALLLNGDKAIVNLSRCMRLPGTYNPKHGKRILCRVIESNDSAGPYRRNNFNMLPELPTNRGRPKKDIEFDNAPVSTALPPDFLTLVEHCPKIAQFWRQKTPRLRKKGRLSFSEDDFALAVMLMEAFYSPAEIASVIANNTKCQRKFNGDPVGRQRYVETTVKNALWKNDRGYSSVVLTT